MEPEKGNSAEMLALRVREACLRVVLDAYEDAGIRGLCAEGRMEAAVDALRSLDLTPLYFGGRGDSLAAGDHDEEGGR